MSPSAAIAALALLLSSIMAVADVPVGYQRIAQSQGVPPLLLYALAMQESQGPGMNQPWPWSANLRGEAFYFKSREDLYRQADSWLSQGITLFDIGPGQINWRWNGHRFASLWEATDPYTNLTVAAGIVREHYDRSGSFELAVGRYHAPSDPVRASRYRQAVRIRLARILGESN